MALGVRRRLNSDGSSKSYPSDRTTRQTKRGIDPHSDRAPQPAQSEIETIEISDFPYVMGSNPPRVDPSVPNGTMWGEYSFYVPQWRKRFVPTKHLKHIRGFPKLDYAHDVVDTEQWDTEIGWARRWIRTLGHRHGRKEWADMYHRSQRPYWYHPGIIEEAVYVDIKAAYPSIYERTSWFVDYQRGKYLSIGGEQLHWPYEFNWKAGRSFIVTAAQSITPQRIVWDGKIIGRMAYNRNLNRPFWSFIMDVLSAIARFTIAAFDPMYYNCDGAIIPSRHLGSYISLCRSAGITTTVKARGNAHVTPSGFWRVGHKCTIPYKQTFGETIHSNYLRIKYPPIDMTLSEASWILNKFALLPASKRGC